MTAIKEAVRSGNIQGILSDRIGNAIQESACGNYISVEQEEFFTMLHFATFMEQYIQEIEAEINRPQYQTDLAKLRGRILGRMMEGEQKELEPVLIEANAPVVVKKKMKKLEKA